MKKYGFAISANLVIFHTISIWVAFNSYNSPGCLTTSCNKTIPYKTKKSSQINENLNTYAIF